MKKFTLFCAVALLLSLVSTGCSSNGGSLTSWCRSGSLFPVSRSAQATQTVYTTAASTSACSPCESVTCSPCEPACQPCEPACQPCEPACNPCVPNCTGIYTRGIIPGPVQ